MPCTDVLLRFSGGVGNVPESPIKRVHAQPNCLFIKRCWRGLGGGVKVGVRLEFVTLSSIHLTRFL